LLSGGETDCELEDDDSSRDVFGMFVMPKSMADYKWDVGTYFLDKEHFRDVIRTYVVHGGRNIRFVKNDKRRIRVRCMGAQGNCPWLAYCALLTSNNNWWVKRVGSLAHLIKKYIILFLSQKLYSD